jgi:hypothetical protein
MASQMKLSTLLLATAQLASGLLVSEAEVIGDLVLTAHKAGPQHKNLKAS